ncbi:hypothetical protein [Halohasta litorea]|uniref:Domain of unknown function domain-containing protein n=1 Tax=Halohasta litorea TaxID=869891 RepID=A0ABD6D718_9EURY|nr:hypothetical protein [Halohasta litorea]
MDDETPGILTTADKKWLRNEIEYKNRQTEFQRREDIRDRVASAMQDFELLIELWSKEERQKAMDEIDTTKSASDMIEFLYLSLNEPAQDADQMTDETAVDQALAFRRSLSDGIRNAKERLGNTPDTVLIDSNTELFETPSKNDLKRAIDTDQWRDANDYVRGAIGVPDDEVIDKDEAASNYHMELHLAIERELYSRRQGSNTDISRHDDYVGSTGLFSNKNDS